MNYLISYALICGLAVSGLNRQSWAAESTECRVVLDVNVADFESLNSVLAEYQRFFSSIVAPDGEDETDAEKIESTFDSVRSFRLIGVMINGELEWQLRVNFGSVGRERQIVCKSILRRLGFETTSLETDAETLIYSSVVTLDTKEIDEALKEFYKNRSIVTLRRNLPTQQDGRQIATMFFDHSEFSHGMLGSKIIRLNDLKSVGLILKTDAKKRRIKADYYFLFPKPTRGFAAMMSFKKKQTVHPTVLPKDVVSLKSISFDLERLNAEYGQVHWMIRGHGPRVANSYPGNEYPTTILNEGYPIRIGKSDNPAINSFKTVEDCFGSVRWPNKIRINRSNGDLVDPRNTDLLINYHYLRQYLLGLKTETFLYLDHPNGDSQVRELFTGCISDGICIYRPSKLPSQFASFRMIQLKDGFDKSLFREFVLRAFNLKKESNRNLHFWESGNEYSGRIRDPILNRLVYGKSLEFPIAEMGYLKSSICYFERDGYFWIVDNAKLARQIFDSNENPVAISKKVQRRIDSIRNDKLVGVHYFDFFKAVECYVDIAKTKNGRRLVSAMTTMNYSKIFRDGKKTKKLREFIEHIEEHFPIGLATINDQSDGVSGSFYFE